MRGGGATPRSGRVRVFALRTVPEGPCRGVVVGIGMSSRWKFTAIEGKDEGKREYGGQSRREYKERKGRRGVVNQTR